MAGRVEVKVEAPASVKLTGSPAARSAGSAFLPFVRLSESSGPRVLFDVCGGYIGGVTPVPIPNTEVKPTRADGTAREAVWESRSPPHFFRKPAGTAGGLFSSAPREGTRMRYTSRPKGRGGG